MKKNIILIIILFLTFLTFNFNDVNAEDYQCVDNETIYDGYCDNWGNFVPGYISNDTWMKEAPNYRHGKMVFYGPYAMKATAEYRGIDYEKEGCIGGVSLMSPSDIGKKVMIQASTKDLGTHWYGPFCVVDCARRGDMYSIVVYRDEVVEINYELAEYLNMVETTSNGYKVNNWYLYVDVYVFPNDAYNFNNINQSFLSKLSVEKVDYSDWFLNNIDFINYRENNISVLNDDNWIWRVRGSNFTGEDIYKSYYFFENDLNNLLGKVVINESY